MNAFVWVERNPVFYFFCASSVLLYIYGIWWTAIILFTIYLLDETFKDTEEEKIYGKQLFDVSRKTNSTDNTYNRKYIVSTDNNMFSNHSSHAKKPNLQDFVNQKKSKENVVRHERQPLAAVVKNNMQIHLSNIDLEKRKPIYQCIRSASPSIMSTRLSRNGGSPSFNKCDGSYFGSYNGSPSLNRSNLNMSVNMLVNSPVVASPNDSLEVHGSYFINRSVLHSPSSERTINNGCFSPSCVPFYKNIRSSASSYPMNCSTESVVEALKQKSKRKRAMAELSDESNRKKKRIDNDIDSTLDDLLPNTQSSSMKQVQTSKRKNVTEKEVISTGVQCLIDEESVIKKKKLQTEDEISYQKYGLSQTQINELSNETTSTKYSEKTEETCIADEKIKNEKKESPKKLSFKNSIRNIAYDCSFKSVSFADNTLDKKDNKEHSIQKSSLKLSALKNMESPYKKLFNNGSTKNITPESIKKMRKHPVYFTAKINIDEIQQHREEFGKSGVSLKAFRLDQEEAIKRVDNLFEDSESDIDFKSQPASAISLVTSSTPETSTAPSIASGVSSNLVMSSQPSTLLTTSSVKSNLFGSAAPSAVIFSSAAISTSSLSFGNLTSTTSFAPVTSFMVSKANVSAITSAPTTAVFQSQQYSSGVPPTEVQQTLLSSSASSLVAPSTINFSTTPTVNLSAATMLGSTSTGTFVLSTQSATSDPTNTLPQIISTSNNFNFGTDGGSTSCSTVQPSSQFVTLQKPIVSSTSTTTIPDSKVSFLLGAEKPTVPNAAAISSTLIASIPSTTQFSFSFQHQPPQTVNSFQSNQNTTVSATTNVQQTVVSTNGLFGVNTSSSQSLSFGATTVASVTKDMFISVSSSALSFPPAVISNNIPNVPPVLSTVPSLPSSGNIFGQLPANNAFGNSALATTQSSMFGNSSTIVTTTFQSSMFGNSSSSTTTTTTQSSIFGNGVSNLPSGLFKQTTTANGTANLSGNVFAPQNKINGFSFTSTAPSNGFNFGASLAQGNAVPSVANGFNVSNPLVAQSNIFGQAAPPTTNVQAPQNIFGTPLANATSSQTIFGAPTISMSSAQSMFGVPATSVPSTQSMFGNTSQNTFGSNSQNTFGSSSNQNVFGATQPPSIFGDQSKISSGFNFGSTVVTTAPTGGFSFGTSTTKSVFGQSNNVFGGTTATNNTGVFGATKPVENPFGQQLKPSTGFDFSGSLTQRPAINFGGATAPAGNAFPTQQTNEMSKNSFNFGSQPLTPTFGATPASPAFGSIQQPTFGSPQPFGTPSLNPAAGGGFTIGSGASNPPPTRQTQRARRRLRR